MNRRRAMVIKTLYAVPYKIDYDLNGGVLSAVNPSTYTIETSEFALNNPTRDGYTFLGWSMGNSDEYVTKSKFGGYGDRYYTAHWNLNTTEDDVSTNIHNLTVDTAADLNSDGVADNYKISFMGSSNFERLNLPIDKLVKGQKYTLSFTESNNATHGNASGYYTTIYGSFVDSAKHVNTTGSIKENCRAQGGLIAEWVDGSSGYVKVLDGKSLNGPRDMTMQFTATNSIMYWIWDYGLITDGVLYTYNLANIVLKPVIPQIKFGSMALKDDTTYVATFNIKACDERNLKFTFEFDGESGAEFLYYPITGLTIGTTYTITFNHKFAGKFINGNNSTYDYGCGILSDVSSAALANKMSGITSNWLSNTWTMNVISNSTESVTLTFTAISDTAYWIWNMANVSDGTIATIDLSITRFSAAHRNGGNIIYI